MCCLIIVYVCVYFISIFVPLACTVHNSYVFSCISTFVSWNLLTAGVSFLILYVSTHFVNKLDKVEVKWMCFSVLCRGYVASPLNMNVMRLCLWCINRAVWFHVRVQCLNKQPAVCDWAADELCPAGQKLSDQIFRLQQDKQLLQHFYSCFMRNFSKISTWQRGEQLWRQQQSRTSCSLMIWPVRRSVGRWVTVRFSCCHCNIQAEIHSNIFIKGWALYFMLYLLKYSLLYIQTAINKSIQFWFRLRKIQNITSLVL